MLNVFLTNIIVNVLIPILLCCVFWSYFRRAKFLKFCKLQGGPKPYPIIGNVNVLFQQNLLDGLSQLKQTYLLPCNFWVWNDYYYVTDCPHEIKTLLSNTSKSFQKAPFYDDLIKIILDNTLLLLGVSDVEKWKAERKILSKAFAPSMWNKYTPVFHRKCCTLLNGLEKIDTFDAFLSALNRNSFEIFMENFMGVETGNHLSENELLTNLTQLTAALGERSTINRFLPHWFYKRYTEEGRLFYRMLNFINGRFKELIDKKRIELLNKNEFLEDLNKLILIEALSCRKDCLSQTNNIYRQMMLIYLTSIETNVLTLGYTLLQLGINSDMQEKAYKEVLNLIGDSREICTKDLSNLKYLEQCIYETIRIYPVVPILGRHITENIQIGNKLLPKGANALISPYLVHRNEKYWREPEKFNPSRFSTENARNIVPGSYIPFLMGPRDCLGRYYSMAQVKILAANILRKYKIFVNPHVADEIKFKHFILIKPKTNFKINFVRRQQEENNISDGTIP